MPFVKGQPRHPDAGRRVGQLGNKSRAIQEMMDEAGYNPHRAMMELATDPDTPLEIRARLHNELAKYIAPQIRAIEATHSGPAGEPLTVEVRLVKPMLEAPVIDAAIDDDEN